MTCRVIPIEAEPGEDDRSRYLKLPTHTQKMVAAGRLEDLLASFHRNAVSAASSRLFLRQLQGDLKRWAQEDLQQTIHIAELEEAMDRRGSHWSLLADWFRRKG